MTQVVTGLALFFTRSLSLPPASCRLCVCVFTSTTKERNIPQVVNRQTDEELCFPLRSLSTHPSHLDSPFITPTSDLSTTPSLSLPSSRSDQGAVNFEIQLNATQAFFHFRPNFQLGYVIEDTR